MGTNTGLPEMDAYALMCIRVQVQRLIGRLRWDEFEDACSEAYCEFLRRKHHFDPDRASYKTFTRAIVTNIVASVSRRLASASRRDLPQSLTVRSGFSRKCRSEIDEAAAVRQAISRLPPNLNELARALQHESIAEISSRTGIPRSTLYERRLELRAQFKEQGFGESYGC